MDKIHPNRRIRVLSVAPHNFAGAGTAHCHTLIQMARRGADVQFVSAYTPFRERALTESGVSIVICTGYSDAYPNSDYVTYGAVAERLISSAKEWLSADARNRVILFSSFLFPFCAASELAARALVQYQERVISIIVPAGSDIWQIGRQIPSVTRSLIESRYVSSVVTYSQKFAYEIGNVCDSVRPIHIIPPIIDTNIFSPLGQDARSELRRHLGLSDECFVVSHCSNHRPIKGIHHLIEICLQFSSHVADGVCLLLVGPVTNHLCDSLAKIGVCVSQDMTPHFAKIGSLLIACIGLQDDTRRFHAISDVAINTSLHDSFNISLGEAMACGVPVLSTDVVGISSLVAEHDCGRLISFDYNSIYDDHSISRNISSTLDYDSALEWLITISKNNVLRQLVGSRGRIAVMKHCSLSSVENKWDKLCGFQS